MSLKDILILAFSAGGTIGYIKAKLSDLANVVKNNTEDIKKLKRKVNNENARK